MTKKPGNVVKFQVPAGRESRSRARSAVPGGATVIILPVIEIERVERRARCHSRGHFGPLLTDVDGEGRFCAECGRRVRTRWRRT